MRSLRFRPHRALSARRTRGDLVRRVAAVVVVAVVAAGAAASALLGGRALAQNADCGPGTAGKVYPVTDCMLMTSTNTITAGGELTVFGGGFKPVSSVSVQLHSTPVTLGSLTSNGLGSVEGGVTIPASTSVGSHELDLSGINPDGTRRLLTASVLIEAATSASSGLSAWFWTGIGVLVFALVGIALVLARGGRRGRRVG